MTAAEREAARLAEILAQIQDFANGCSATEESLIRIVELAGGRAAPVGSLALPADPAGAHQPGPRISEPLAARILALRALIGAARPGEFFYFVIELGERQAARAAIPANWPIEIVTQAELDRIIGSARPVGPAIERDVAARQRAQRDGRDR